MNPSLYRNPPAPMHKQPDPAPEQEDDEGPSKSQLKREAHALLELGRTLVELPEGRLAALPLDDKLRDAVQLARRIHARSGRKRQIQYIGKLLRNGDPQPVIDALAAIQQEDRRAARAFHQLEDWRERFIHEGDEAVGDWLVQYPGTDRQHLRQLIRQAQKDYRENRTKGPRALFRFLREVAASHTADEP
ncbi:ribosome biogenesis factor YjgA [Thiohalobacter sp. COW1]|uniref:ribosome biogenesis factor YjgA n=1 Tax=Thiohalobacter sp. COW1 TaxID=2795687 RepID=UPI0019152C23|nr:ribosome biogenesis factor YjgA [Thiohalobacter sp. COW1]